MVSTRNHPSNFPPPSNPPSTTSSPTKRPPRTPSPSHSISSTRGQQNHATASTRRPWSHTPTHLTLLWLLLSLPLVIWDTGYVLLRPHSMPGGSLHSPLWIPYALYGTVDYIYGWPAFEARNGFTSAQGVMNLVETALYGGYVWGCWVWGREQKDVEGRGVKLGAWGAMARTVSGKKAAWLVVVGFSAAVLTVGKTVLYWLNEYFSGFDNIGHNDAYALLVLWVIPNGMWLVFPTYMIYILGQEILEGLAIASGEEGGAAATKPLTIKEE